MNRLIFVANRLPVTISSIGKDRIEVTRSVGGLATGLSSVYRDYDSMWIGWSGIQKKLTSQEEELICTQLMDEHRNYPVFLESKDIDDFYFGFCNKIIWPMFHGFTEYAQFGEHYMEAYRRVNQTFADELINILKPGDMVWVHDYHLMLLPALLRERNPDIAIGFFLHIPFPSSEIFRLIPWREEILTGLIGSDLIGFHTYDYIHHFFSSIRRLLGYEQMFDRLVIEGRSIKVDAFPMGIDFERWSKANSLAEVHKNIDQYRSETEDCQVVLSVDRMDYTKGIIKRLEAIEAFLYKYPEHREKVRIVVVAVPSRTGVDQYQMLKEEIDEMISKINGEYGTLGWMPIWYFYRSLPFEQLSALYSLSEVALVTPLRDGMNLVAKEFLATKTDNKGVLILSEMAGVASELGEAIIVNPNAINKIADSIHRALTMPEDEQIERNSIMRNRLERYTVSRWGTDFISAMQEIKEEQHEIHSTMITSEDQTRLKQGFDRAKKRILLLDYDGTLVSIAGTPAQARPDDDLLTLLTKLTGDSRNTVVIISGRDKKTLEQWIPVKGIHLIAEHGAWIREGGNSWEPLELISTPWKEEVRPILEMYVDRTPGSFIEEKDFSLVWHYRKVDSEFSAVRVREVQETLVQLSANLDLSVMRGKKVLEIKPVGINKGIAAHRWLEHNHWEFILAAGDDVTDEDLFEILPESAWSLKVGTGQGHAQYNIQSPQAFRTLLESLL